MQSELTPDFEASTLRHYAVLAPYIDELFGPEDAPLQSALHQIALRYASVSSTMLDFGCGLGATGLAFALKGFPVHFLDPVEDNLACIRRQLGATNGCQTATSLAALTGDYTLVIIKEVLYHILSASRRLDILCQIRKRLCAGGVVLIVQAFLDEAHWTNPRDFTLVTETPTSRMKVYLRRTALSAVGASATFLRLVPEHGTPIDVPPAYFGTFGYDELLHIAKSAGLRQAAAIDMETGQNSSGVTANRMYALVLTAM